MDEGALHGKPGACCNHVGRGLNARCSAFLLSSRLVFHPRPCFSGSAFLWQPALSLKFTQSPLVVTGWMLQFGAQFSPRAVQIL